MFAATIAGSLPKPSWLAEPDKLWPAWRCAGPELAAAKRDATLLVIKEQEDAGIDIVTDGEQSRQHFVHGFLEHVEGIDFTRRVEMGIRKDRYKAMVPTVVGPLGLKGRVHATEARLARAHTKRRLKFTLPGPMTVVDTIANGYYRDKVELAMAFAGLLNQEARALASDGVDVYCPWATYCAASCWSSDGLPRSGADVQPSWSSHSVPREARKLAMPTM